MILTSTYNYNTNNNHNNNNNSEDINDDFHKNAFAKALSDKVRLVEILENTQYKRLFREALQKKEKSLEIYLTQDIILNDMVQSLFMDGKSFFLFFDNNFQKSSFFSILLIFFPFFNFFSSGRNKEASEVLGIILIDWFPLTVSFHCSQ